MAVTWESLIPIIRVTVEILAHGRLTKLPIKYAHHARAVLLHWQQQGVFVKRLGIRCIVEFQQGKPDFETWMTRRMIAHFSHWHLQLIHRAWRKLGALEVIQARRVGRNRVLWILEYTVSSAAHPKLTKSLVLWVRWRLNVNERHLNLKLEAIERLQVCVWLEIVECAKGRCCELDEQFWSARSHFRHRLAASAELQKHRVSGRVAIVDGDKVLFSFLSYSTYDNNDSSARGISQWEF